MSLTVLAQAMAKHSEARGFLHINESFAEVQVCNSFTGSVSYILICV